MATDLQQLTRLLGSVTTFVKLCEHAGACYDVYRPSDRGLERCKANCPGCFAACWQGPLDADTTNKCQIPGFGHARFGLACLKPAWPQVLFDRHVFLMPVILKLLISLLSNIASQRDNFDYYISDKIEFCKYV